MGGPRLLLDVCCPNTSPCVVDTATRLLGNTGLHPQAEDLDLVQLYLHTGGPLHTNGTGELAAVSGSNWTSPSTS